MIILANANHLSGGLPRAGVVCCRILLGICFREEGTSRGSRSSADVLHASRDYTTRNKGR